MATPAFQHDPLFLSFGKKAPDNTKRRNSVLGKLSEPPWGPGGGCREKAALPPGLPLAGTWGALWSSVWGGARGVRHWRSQADPRELTQGGSWVPSSLGVFKLLLESPGDHRAVEEGGAQGQGFSPSR